MDKVIGDPGHDGIRIDRTATFYDESEVGDLFTGYPSKRPWFPLATFGNYQEVIPSIQNQYPYGIKVLITYWNAWPYSTPALRKVWQATVADETKLPLLVSISPLIGEVAAWADYVLPDSTYLEKFAVPGIPWRVNKGTAFQRPVVGKFDGKPIGVSVLSASMLMLGGKAHSISEGIVQSRSAIASGRAYQSFHDMVRNQGGDERELDRAGARTPCALEVCAEDAGYVYEIDALAIGLASLQLGAGRRRMEDAVDPNAGIVLVKKVGDAVKAGEALAQLFTERTEELTPVRASVSQAFVTRAVARPPSVH